jgi:hypothetical protein
VSTAPTPANATNGVSSAHDLFALTDEQILEIAPDAQDVEVFGGERSDRMDPLREDLDLLASHAPSHRTDGPSAGPNQGQNTDDGLKGVAPTANATAQDSQPVDAATNANDAAPQWLAERMNDPQHGAEARALWQGAQAARQEASAFREVFARPEDARAAANRARMLDEIDHAYFGTPGHTPEHLSASRAQLAAMMQREDPAAFREMVFAGLRALESAGQQGTGAANSQNALSTPPHATSQASPTSAQFHSPAQSPPTPAQPTEQNNAQFRPPQNAKHQQQDAQRQQEARVAAYAAFERTANEELERGVGGAIERSLQQALPNASRTENGAGLKQRLSAAVRQDVEKALQGDHALGEQVARILSAQRLDDAARAQVVRLIGDRAQQLVPGATRRVLADWTQTTLAAHGAHGNQDQSPARQRHREAAGSAAAQRSTAPVAQKNTTDASARARSAPRKIDYRRVSDDDILDS